MTALHMIVRLLLALPFVVIVLGASMVAVLCTIAFFISGVVLIITVAIPTAAAALIGFLGAVLALIILQSKSH